MFDVSQLNQAFSETVAIWWKFWSAESDALNNLVTTLAVIIGGGSAYIKLFRGQTWFYRIQPKVEASWQEIDGQRYLRVKTEIKNLGNGSFHFARKPECKIDENNEIVYPIDKHGKSILINKSMLIVSAGTRSSPTDIPARITWQDDFAKCTVAPLFANHEWIRAGETVEEEHLLLATKGSAFSYRVEARIISKPKWSKIKASFWKMFKKSSWVGEGEWWPAYAIIIEEEGEPNDAKLE